MTESVAVQSPAVIRAALESELLLCDALAEFKTQDSFKIHHFGDKIDNIPNPTPELSISARKIANLFNEPDTEGDAFNEPPPFRFPESQERFEQLKSTTVFDDYLQFSQSQSVKSSQLSQLHVPPAPNQENQAIREQLLRPPVLPSSAQARSSSLQLPTGSRQGSREPSPVRKSSRPAAPKVFKGYVMGSGETSGSAKEYARDAGGSDGVTSSHEDENDEDLPSASKLSRKVRHLSASNPSPRRSPSPGPSKKKARANPAPRRSAPPTAEERKLLAQAKKAPTPPTEPRRPLNNPPRKMTRATSQEAALPPSPAERARAAQRQAPVSVGDGFEDCEGENEGPSFLDIVAAQQKTTGRELARVPTNTTNALAVSKQDGALTQSAREAKLGAPMYEGDVPLSRAAKASLLGWTVAEGYEGFKYISTFKKGDKIKESWLCLKCGEPKTASMQGKPTNLKLHLGSCNGPKTDAAAALIRQAEEGAEKRSSMPETSTLAGSYRGTSVRGWLNAHQALDIDLTRRLALVCVIRNALPFTLLSSVSMKKLIRSLDHRATTSFKSARQVQRDLKKFNSHLASNLISELQGMDTLMALQHDGWTNKGFQHSFMGIIGSYVDAKWEYHERLLSFDVVQEKHSGATFAGHLVRTIKKLKLDDKWYGAVVSDSAGTNTRMLTLMEHDLEEEHMQQRDPSAHQDDLSVQKMLKASCSAFPKASLRNTGTWTANDYRILCLNHHINLAVRDGFAKFDIKVKTKTQRKVLDIRPKPRISVVDENGKEIILSDSDDVEPEEDEEDDAAAEDGEEEEEDGDDVISPLNLAEDEDDEEALPEMAPGEEDIGSDDDGGPEASGETRPSGNQSKPVNGVAKLAAFTTWIHRSSQRQVAFRRRMQQEYHHQPLLAEAPFPSKPNKTRWNSHFAMIQSALDIRAAIDSHCRAHIGVRGEVLGDYLLTDTQWQQLKLLEPILGLAASITKKMEKTEGTLYAVLDYHASLRDEIAAHVRRAAANNALDEETRGEITKFLNAMENKLRKYRNIALRNRVILAATLLHPNNRKLFKISYPTYPGRAETALRELLDELVDSSQSPAASPVLRVAQLASSSTEPPSPCSAARARREEAADESNAALEDRDRDDEVTRYLDPKNSPWRTSDRTPYKWWRDNEAVFPTISKLARIILAIPGSSSAVERVFSQAALVSTNRRGSLSAASISRLVTTRHWLVTGADEFAGLPEQALKVAHSHLILPDPDDTKRKANNNSGAQKKKTNKDRRRELRTA